MFWGIWLVFGAGLGWWAHVLFRAEPVPPPERDDEREDRPAQGFLYLALLAILLARLFRADGPQQAVTPDAAAQAVAPASQPTRWIPYLIFFIMLVVVVIAASEPSIDWLPAFVRWFVALLLSERMMALLAGAALGYCASGYRHLIAARLHDFYEAFLGSDTKSSWALQSLVAIITLLLIVLAIKPDLLDKLESFKAGDVEAKFASVSTATREARVITNDLTGRVAIDIWLNFKEYYREGSPRDDALEFDGSEIKELRKRLRDLLFEDYVEPLIRSLACLYRDNRLDRLKSSEDFVRLAVVLRNKILKEAKDGSGAAFTKADWLAIFEMADAQTRKATEIVEKEVPQDIAKDKCEWDANLNADLVDPNMKRNFDASLADLMVRRAVEKLQASPAERQYRLSFIDPYFVAAVSDLVALTLGQTEKASFLVQVKGAYPKSLDYIQPGLINLYVYLSDAKSKSDTLWPLDEELEELNFAMAGADRLISASRNRAAELTGTASKAGKQTATRYDGIVHIYFRNKFIIQYLYLSTFFQRVLSGETLAPVDRQRWTQLYKQTESILNLRELGPSLSLADASATVDRDAADWTSFEIPPQYKFDARIALAMSAVMLTEQNNRSTPQACTIARFHAQKANELVPELVRNLDFNEADKSRLHGFLLQIAARVRVSCPDSPSP
jgi:hypothetical protein